MIKSISELLISPWTTYVVFTAIRLKIFTVLSNKMMTVEELSTKCGAIPHLLKPVLDVCVSIGLMECKNKKYRNSHFSSVYLVEGSPQYVGDFLQLLYDESKNWDGLLDIVLEGKCTRCNEPDDEARLKTFIKAMNNLGTLGEAEALLNFADLSGCREMIDAGGGSGIYSIFFCRKYPHLRTTILDRSQTLVITEEIIAEYEGRDRITLREADITKESFGENIDVVLLSDVIYDESTAELVLKNAWNCLRQNGILIIRGYYSDPENSRPLFGALFVLNMIVFDPTRRVMTISALEKRIRDNGFTVSTTDHLTERSFAVMARK